MRVGIVPGCAVKKEITIEECLLPINATLFGVNFDPPHQMVHACECGDDTDISVSEELYEAMRQHFAAHRWLLDSPPNKVVRGAEPSAGPRTSPPHGSG